MEKPIKNTDLPELKLIAERLQMIRKEKGYSNYEHIAFALGMSRSAYWRLESGANFELKTLINICKFLGISLEDFFKGINSPQSNKE
jgi:transcriptional regulator with XRE-family HTH domain